MISPERAPVPLLKRFDVERVRADFPALAQQVHGRPLVYLDNAATTQKPAAVIEALDRYYTLDNANVHRGVHELAARATEAFEGAREKARAFLGARSAREIVFVRGTTEAINLIAHSFGQAHVRAGDEILVSEMEHHSNIVPWQMLCERSGATLRMIPMSDRGELLLEEFEKRLNDRTKLVGIVHVSNALGTINPLKAVIERAHTAGAKVLVDGAQAVAHIKVDVQDLDCDFYAFSGHKLYGPTGIGVLYGREELLEALPPWHGGGEMISHVSFERSTWNALPYKFEAGTPHIAGVVGLGAALDYVGAIGLGEISAHERGVLNYAIARAAEMPGMRLIGTAPLKCGVLSFVIERTHAADLGALLDLHGVAIRAGHHCAMPAMQHFCLPATARASFAMYNTREEVDQFFEALEKVRRMLVK